MHYRERRCPHCGRTNGMFAKYSIRNVRMFYDFEGNETGESMDVSEVEGGKNLYCEVCERFVCKAKDYHVIYG